MTILVTNDDGLTDGLRILSEAAARLDKDSYTITPSQQRSAVAKGVTLHKILRIRRVGEEKLPIYALTGTPADCVSFALFSKEFRKPDFVLSGVNIGDNLSLHAIYSSGTIGACLEASFYGIPAIAFSLEKHKEERAKANYGAWENHEPLVKKVVEIAKRFKSRIPPYSLLNVNFPRDFENAKIVFPKPTLIKYASAMEKRIDPNNTPYYWHYGAEREGDAGSDAYELYANGCITITPISILKIVDEELIKKLAKS